MISYILRRLCLFVGTMFALTIVLYWIHIRLTPSVDFKVIQDYVNYTHDLLTFNFGVSLDSGLKITDEMKEFCPASIELLVSSFLLAFIIGMPLGSLLAYAHRSWFDRLMQILSQVLSSIPVYWLAQLLIILFCISLKLFPTYGNISLLYDIEPVTGFSIIDSILTKDPEIISNTLKHFFLPVLSLSLMPLIEIMMLSRTATLQVYRANFIKASISRGLGYFAIFRHNVLRNIIPGIVPQLNIILCNLISALILVEVIFEWPGMGVRITSCVTTSDYPMLEAITFVLATVLLIINILSDVLITVIFPLKKRLKIKV